MKTSCKSCHNWDQTDSDKGWCRNFKRQMINNNTCGEWRARKAISPGA